MEERIVAYRAGALGGAIASATTDTLEAEEIAGIAERFAHAMLAAERAPTYPEVKP